MSHSISIMKITRKLNWTVFDFNAVFIIGVTRNTGISHLNHISFTQSWYINISFNFKHRNHWYPHFITKCIRCDHKFISSLSTNAISRNSHHHCKYTTPSLFHIVRMTKHSHTYSIPSQSFAKNDVLRNHWHSSLQFGISCKLALWAIIISTSHHWNQTLTQDADRIRMITCPHDASMSWQSFVIDDILPIYRCS